MFLSIAEVEPAPKSKKVVGEPHVNTPLLPILSTARNHSAERPETTDLSGGAST